jgi:hypothetical protein
MGANANRCTEAPIKARDKAKTGRLGEECNDEWRLSAPVPSGLLPKTRIAALPMRAGGPARHSRCAIAGAF